MNRLERTLACLLASALLVASAVAQGGPGDPGHLKCITSIQDTELVLDDAPTADTKFKAYAKYKAACNPEEGEPCVLTWNLTVTKRVLVTPPNVYGWEKVASAESKTARSMGCGDLDTDWVLINDGSEYVGTQGELKLEVTWTLSENMPANRTKPRLSTRNPDVGQGDRDA